MSGEDQVEKIGSALWDRPDPGFFWRRLLAAPTGGGRGFRRWNFWIWWARPRSPHERMGAIKQLVFSPASAVVESVRAVGRYGPKVAKTHGISRVAQGLQLVSLRARSGVPAVAYYKYSLFRPERQRFAGQYLSETGKLLQVLSRRLPSAPDLDIFVNKARFEVWCREQGFPTVPNLLEFKQGEVVTRTVEELPPCDLFSKPSNAQAGEGVSRWTHRSVTGKSDWSSETGDAYSAAGLEDHLRELSLKEARPFVLQPRLRNHKRIDRLANGSLSTIRLMTLRATGDRAHPLLAVLRLPTGSSVADNFDLGGLGAPIDLATGTLGPAVFKRGDYPLEEIEHHPDSGARLAGETIPFWEDCLAFCLRAHDAVHAEMPVIGWDVAVLDTGPLLMEANHMPCPQLAQMTTGIPLGTTPYADYILAGMRKAFSL